jgi:hypothetical protein
MDLLIVLTPHAGEIFFHAGSKYIYAALYPAVYVCKLGEQALRIMAVVKNAKEGS